MPERSRDWLTQAIRDLKKAYLDLEHGFYEWACFTAQQAAEKAVKALYYATNRDVRGHSIARMLSNAREFFDVPEELIHRGRILDRYYIEARYPNGFPEGYPAEYFDRDIAKEAVDAAEEIIRFVENTIGR